MATEKFLRPALNRILVIFLIVYLGVPNLVAAEDGGSVDLRCFSNPEWTTISPGENLSLFFPSNHGAMEILGALGELDDPMGELRWYSRCDCKDCKAFSTFVLGFIADMKSYQGNEDGMYIGNSQEGLRKAFRFYEYSANLGFSYAQSNLCHRLISGSGTPKNYVTAKKWCESAAAVGDPLAIMGLGEIYINGFGVDKDYGQAYMWYLVADAFDLSDIWRTAVQNQIRKLEKSLSTSEINVVQNTASKKYRSIMLASRK